jgi:hypothetical protein
MVHITKREKHYVTGSIRINIQDFGPWDIIKFQEVFLKDFDKLHRRMLREVKRRTSETT